MSDNADVCIEEHDQDIFLYTHWEGHTLPILVGRVLARRTRWRDAHYLARMVFSEMIAVDLRGDGNFGISTIHRGADYPLLTLHVDRQEVEAECRTERVTFAEFVEMRELERMQFAGRPDFRLHRLTL